MNFYKCVKEDNRESAKVWWREVNESEYNERTFAKAWSYSVRQHVSLQLVLGHLNLELKAQVLLKDGLKAAQLYSEIKSQLQIYRELFGNHSLEEDYREDFYCWWKRHCDAVSSKSSDR